MAQKRPLDDPLDETVFRSEEMLFRTQGIHDNSILFYFAESPFFDKTSNNGVYYTQAVLNANLLPTLGNRAAFEAELDKRYGQEYRIAEKPAETAPGMGTGVWVIRRQDRNLEDGREMRVVRESFFVVGERVYQAPSAADVLGSSLVCGSN
jgi:mediator of RNA polymerase II transcription subunit 6